MYIPKLIIVIFLLVLLSVVFVYALSSRNLEKANEETQSVSTGTTLNPQGSVNNKPYSPRTGTQEPVGTNVNSVPIQNNTIKQAPALEGIVPAVGRIGTRVTLIGTGFTQDNNVVLFGSDYSEYLNSSDGTTLIFTIPPFADRCHPSGNPCYEIKNQEVVADTYSVYVTNTHGESNRLNFTVVN